MLTNIVLKGFIIVPDSDLIAVSNALTTHITLTRQEEGCLVFNVEQDKADVNKFFVYEEFTNQLAFDAHQVRVKNSNWGRITQNIERHYQLTNSTSH